MADKTFRRRHGPPAIGVPPLLQGRSAAVCRDRAVNTLKKTLLLKAEVLEMNGNGVKNLVAETGRKLVIEDFLAISLQTDKLGRVRVRGVIKAAGHGIVHEIVIRRVFVDAGTDLAHDLPIVAVGLGRGSGV